MTFTTNTKDGRNYDVTLTEEEKNILAEAVNVLDTLVEIIDRENIEKVSAGRQFNGYMEKEEIEETIDRLNYIATIIAGEKYR